MPGKLTLVATPVGNLGDMSPRAVDALREADFIAAEDTRVTLKLLNHFEIKKPLVSYYEHNKYSSGERILARILAGESCALVTDAGMPAVSDPGAELVELCAENGVEVTAVPGACAAVLALALSALPTGRFCFEGFLSVTRKTRLQRLGELKAEVRTMIFYEAPHKLLQTLRDLYAAFGDRRITLCRELTKLHEEVIRTTLSQAVEKYGAEPPRGEFVLVVEGAPEETVPDVSPDEAEKIILRFLDAGLSVKESARRAAAETGFSKNVLYELALKIRDKQGTKSDGGTSEE